MTLLNMRGQITLLAGCGHHEIIKMCKNTKSRLEISQQQLSNEVMIAEKGAMRVKGSWEAESSHVEKALIIIGRIITE